MLFSQYQGSKFSLFTLSPFWLVNVKRQTNKIMKHTTNKPSTTHSTRLLLALLVITSVSATTDTTTITIDPSKLSTNISDIFVPDPVDYKKKKNDNSSFLRFDEERGSTTASSTSIANEPSARNITMLYCDSASMLPNPLGMPKRTNTDRNDLPIIPAVSSLPMKRDSTAHSMIAESKITDNISMRTIAVPHHHGNVNGNCLGNYSIVLMTRNRRSDSYGGIGEEEEEVS